MGWSCRKEASDTLQRISKKCIGQTGFQNTFKQKEATCFWETDGNEHEDGAITGTVSIMVGETGCKDYGSFRIELDGTMWLGPAILRLWAKEQTP